MMIADDNTLVVVKVRWRSYPILSPKKTSPQSTISYLFRTAKLSLSGEILTHSQFPLEWSQRPGFYRFLKNATSQIDFC